MGFGHIYIDAPQEAVLASMDRHLASLGFEAYPMTAVEHPSRPKEIHETRTRLYWVSPRLGRWTGIFEWRYYNNALRERWGYTDEKLAIAVSRELKAETYRVECIDQAGFWLYAHYLAGVEKDGSAFHDTPETRSLDPNHPRYALNRIVEREGFKNIGLGYETIPGPEVETIDAIPQTSTGIEGFDEFVHKSYRHPNPPQLPQD